MVFSSRAATTTTINQHLAHYRTVRLKFVVRSPQPFISHSFFRNSQSLPAEQSRTLHRIPPSARSARP